MSLSLDGDDDLADLEGDLSASEPVAEPDSTDSALDLGDFSDSALDTGSELDGAELDLSELDADTDLADIELDMTGDDAEDEGLVFAADGDEIATKLDLARAYIDMGDHDGARGILEEVIGGGSEAQQQEARELLEGID
jgi:pilus assembly protein FimV